MPRKTAATGPKTVSVRITVPQFNTLREIAESLGGSVNGLTQKAVGNWIADEGDYWREVAVTAKSRRHTKVTACQRG